MIRNLKTLGVALVAIFAMSAVVASAASAVTEGQLTSDGPVTLLGTETGEPQDNSLTFNGKVLTCPGTTYTGHKYNVTPHELIPNGAKTVTITPHYRNCVSSGPIPVTVDMNGCDYVFHLGEKISEHTYGITADIVCNGGGQITITAFSSSSHALKVCTQKVKTATGLTGLHVKHTTSPADDIDLTGTLEVDVEQSGVCGALSGKGVLHVDVTVKGLNSEGLNTPVTVTDTVI